MLIADCHCVLGRVTARSGDTGLAIPSGDAAAAEFKKACEVAHEAQAFAYEVVAAQQWKSLMESSDTWTPRDISLRQQAADAAIGAACESMGKGRDAFKDLLEGSF